MNLAHLRIAKHDAISTRSEHNVRLFFGNLYVSGLNCYLFKAGFWGRCCFFIRSYSNNWIFGISRIQYGRSFKVVSLSTTCFFVYLMVKISQWKHALHKICVRIVFSDFALIIYVCITWWWIWSLYYIDSFDDYDDDFVDNGFHQLNQQHLSNEVYKM